MNKQIPKNYVIGSVVSTMFIGLGFGIAMVSPILAISIGGFVMGIISLIVMYILLIKVEKAGYKIKMIIEGDKDEQKT